MSNVTTTKNGFPVVDVTHRPKRMQADNLRTAVVEGTQDTPSTSDVPKIVTLERAILYYESHAEGDLKSLYTQTAQWLRERLSKSVPVPEGDDIDKAQELFSKVRGGSV